jgi:superkiller protein 3
VRRLISICAVIAALSLSLSSPAINAGLALAAPESAQSPAFDPYAAGRAALKRHDYKSAVRYFKMAIAHSENLIASEIGLGAAAFALGEAATSYRAYARAATLAPSNPQAVYGAADSAYEAHQYRAAVDYATSYIKLRPKEYAGYKVRFLAEGRLLDAKGQLRDARQLVKLFPHQAESFNDLGIALSNSGKFGSAIQAFTTAIKLLPNTVDYYINRAIAENLDRKPRLALADLETARRLAKDRATQRNLDKAISSLKKKFGL